MIVEQKKFVAMTDNRILCVKGWVLNDEVESNQIKLFNSKGHVQEFINNSSFVRPKYKIAKAKARIEVFEDDCYDCSED